LLKCSASFISGMRGTQAMETTPMIPKVDQSAFLARLAA
jgi:hypothetical protein